MNEVLKKLGPGQRFHDKTPDPIDSYVGSRVRVRRIACRMSQTELADAVGITFQQIQKYEKGLNRIGASRLFRIARALEVPVGYFYDGYETADGSTEPAASGVPVQNPMMDRHSLELVRFYNGITDERIRRYIFGLIRGLYEKEADGDS